MMVLSPELLGLTASVVGVIGLILRKARCFIRRVGSGFDWGLGFTDNSIVPESEVRSQSAKQSPLRNASKTR
jgi:hypothetical protein